MSTSYTPDAIVNIDDLRIFIHTALCAKENLPEEQFPMTQMTLIKRRRYCGLQFSLQGPRSVRLGAIWAADQNIIYLYDARGERYQKIRLPRRVNMPAEARVA